ncbi:hypothetical protein [Brevundimonas mediterranea]|jgi:hypothetical protein|uniref:hypothetical protein n=1 Tax=Brevundimonas mediterranea TaxID=74329 RepID=UPI0011FEADB3|nr:hypothetical protein [uncultured Brevundimonas sp.]RZJ47527.1 MAG: hypothetical protein EON87_00295 [Brevundimonas sp.]
MAFDDDKQTTFFDVWGPFEIAHDGNWIKGAQGDLWSELEDRCEGLSTAIGCYMFCLRTHKQIRPWYVGMTLAKAGFRGEVFQLHKLNSFNFVMNAHATAMARPILFFFPLMTPTRRFSTAGSSGKPVIEWMERYLMMTAFARNPAITNVRDMAMLRRVEVPGLLGKRPGRPHSDVQSVRQALFGSSRRPSDGG